VLEFGGLEGFGFGHAVVEVVVELNHEVFGGGVFGVPEGGHDGVGSGAFPQVGKSGDFFAVGVGFEGGLAGA